jgi:hypothetical protein
MFKRQNDTLTQSFSAIFTVKTPTIPIGKDIDALLFNKN